jgi:dTDP-4-dehydrorhamnose reductase
MKLAVLGCNGQLGTDMVRYARDAGLETEGFDLPEVDITHFDDLRSLLRRCRPDAIVNCAAYAAVDDCEGNPDTAFTVNADGVANIARAAYVETDPPNPRSVYGKSKLAGEELLARNTDRFYVIRTAWLYGAHGGNFVRSILNVGRRRQREGGTVRVVNDQIGSPTHTLDVCAHVLDIVGSGRFGIYHCTSGGACSWYDFARRILRVRPRSSPGRLHGRCTVCWRTRGWKRAGVTACRRGRTGSIGFSNASGRHSPMSRLEE